MPQHSRQQHPCVILLAPKRGLARVWVAGYGMAWYGMEAEDVGSSSTTISVDPPAAEGKLERRCSCCGALNELLVSMLRAANVVDFSSERPVGDVRGSDTRPTGIDWRRIRMGADFLLRSPCSLSSLQHQRNLECNICQYILEVEYCIRKR